MQFVKYTQCNYLLLNPPKEINWLQMELKSKRLGNKTAYPESIPFTAEISSEYTNYRYHQKTTKRIQNHLPLVVTHTHTNKASSWHDFFKIISSSSVFFRTVPPSIKTRYKIESDLGSFQPVYNPRSIFGFLISLLFFEREGEKNKNTESNTRFRSAQLSSERFPSLHTMAVVG